LFKRLREVGSVYDVLSKKTELLVGDGFRRAGWRSLKGHAA
jgi:hypothetical protein